MIPKPLKKTSLEKFFVLKSSTKFFYEEKMLSVVDYFRKVVSKATGYQLKRQTREVEEDIIMLKIDPSLKNLSAEGYILDISTKKIVVKASNVHGVFYALQSVRQLLPKEIEIQNLTRDIEWKIPCLKIEDSPRFKWRGFMFDVGRHFHPIETIKQYLDILALLKMNTFHWHLTEDQGWRVEIKKYPKLTEIGSKRKDSKIGGWVSKKYRGEPHEGFYTQEEIKEVVNYAAERFITVIPEIEMPGHSSAVVAAYPEISCRKEVIEVPTKFGIFADVFCVGQERTYEIIEDILDEILNLFPSKIIHIGGDEVKKKNWKECLICQQKMKEENMAEISELHSYFTKRIRNYLASKGRRMMGWNEILDEETDASVIGQFWVLTGKKSVLKHIEKEGEIVISNFFRYYLDYDYIMTPLRKTYKFEPIPKELKHEFHERILGVEAPIWTEWVPTKDRLDWQVFPRLLAVAETGWTSKENKNYSDFKCRLERLSERLNLIGINHASLDEVDPNRISRLLKARRVLKWPEI